MTEVAVRVRDEAVEMNLKRTTADSSPTRTVTEEVEFAGVCNFTDWSELRPGFLEREEPQR
jgi:hypothetical protein